MVSRVLVKATGWCVSLLLAATACSGAAVAQLAGGGLNDGSFIGSSGSLRDTVSSLLAPPAVNTGLPLTFSGDVDVEVGASDNAGSTNRGWQPFLLIAPDFNLNGVTSRLNVALTYSPRLALYPGASGQTLLSHTFNGTATATIVPDLLFFNVRGATSVGSRFGYDALQSNTFYSRNDAVQTSSFSASPYLQHTFAGWGTLTAAYIYTRTFQDSAGTVPFNFIAQGVPSTAGFGTIGDLSSNTETASFTTGENLGRIQDRVSVTAVQNSGSDFYADSSTFSADNTLSYALYRWLTVFASVGYEEYRYPRGGYNLSEPIWSVGATVTPNADSSITVQYGQTAGINTIQANGSFSPTARTRLFGSYSVGIQTGLGARQNLLNSTTVGPGGILIDRASGLPIVGNNYLASQYPLSRVKTLTVGGILLLTRDTLSASYNRSQATQLVNSTDVLGVATGVGTSTDYSYATLAWQHDLNPSTSLISSVSYSTNNTGVFFGAPGETQDTVQFYTSLNHVFTETLSGSVSYSHAERYGGAIRNLPASFGGNTSQNTVLVGLRKSF